MTLTGIVLPVIGLGALLLLLGIALVVKHSKIAGIIIALFGVALVAVPVLSYTSLQQRDRRFRLSLATR